MKEIVIPRENAVFRLDGNGFWRNEHGKFEHKKIIDYFHRSIQRDADGYYLTQDRGEVREKVYFPYEDTALFVFDVIRGPDILLVLNTGEKIRLHPDQLRIKGDHLYMLHGEDRIKFTDRSLLKITDLIRETGGAFFIRFQDTDYQIAEIEFH
jgi:hypothetical protein